MLIKETKMEMSIKNIVLLCIAAGVVCNCSASITRNGQTHTRADELPDFEFDDNYSIDKFHNQHTQNSQSSQANLNLNDFDDFFIDDGDDNDRYIELDIASKKKMLKAAILRALSTQELKYKFSEVLPLLRHLSKAQRMVFSSIISAQINGARSFTFDEV